MIVVGLAAIIVSLAVPAYRDYSERNQLETSVDRLTRSLTFARSEAITTLTRYPNDELVICPSGDSMAANPVCSSAASRDYEDGWLVFIDCNGNELFQPGGGNLCDTDGNGVGDAPELLLQVFPPLNDVDLESTTIDRVRFGQLGEAVTSVSFQVKKDTRTYADIAMNVIGRLRITPNTSFYD